LLLIEKKAAVSAADKVWERLCCAAAGRYQPTWPSSVHSVCSRGVVQNGETLLHCAALGGKVDIVLLLIEKGAAVSAANKVWERLCFAAAGRYQPTWPSSVHSACSRGIVQNGGTALHYAATAEAGNLDIVKLLIEKGAAVSAANKVWERLCFAAAGRYQPTWPSSVHSACSHGVVQYGETALHYAAMAGNIDILKLLLKKGADVSAADKVREL
jgi:ankyrin repeat protein